MTSSQAFRRFAFAYGTAFAVLYVVALKPDLALLPSIPHSASSSWARTIRRDTSTPHGFVVAAMYWYGWTATAALGALVFGLLAALLPERWTRRFWRDGHGRFPQSR